jgi:hypothetical protein
MAPSPAPRRRPWRRLRVPPPRRPSRSRSWSSSRRSLPRRRPHPPRRPLTSPPPRRRPSPPRRWSWIRCACRLSPNPPSPCCCPAPSICPPTT